MRAIAQISTETPPSRAHSSRRRAGGAGDGDGAVPARAGAAAAVLHARQRGVDEQRARDVGRDDRRLHGLGVGRGEVRRSRSGGSCFLRGTVAPSYDWYYRTKQLRGFGGSYSGEALGLFNRVTLGAGGGYDRRIATVTSEVARDVLNTSTRGFAKAEVEVLKRLSLFGGAEVCAPKLEDKALATPGPLAGQRPRQDGDCPAGRGPLRLLVGSLVRRDGRGGPDAVRQERRGARLRREGAPLRRPVRPGAVLRGGDGGSAGREAGDAERLPSRSSAPGPTGTSCRTSSRGPLELQVLGSRRPVAALFLDNPYYFETRNGVNLRLAVGRRLSLHVHGRAGLEPVRQPGPRGGDGRDRRPARRHDALRGRVRLQGLAGGERGADRSRRTGGTRTSTTTTGRLFRITGGLRITADFAREERR